MFPRRVVVAVAALMVAVVPLSACSSSTQQEATEQKTVEAPKPTPEAKVEPVTITVVGTGDVLSHMPVVHHSIQADGRYDYEPLVEPIKPYIEGADLALCHQEIPYIADDSQASGYPVFRAPSGWAASTKKLGYDGCSMASNHTWDRQRRGIDDTIAILREQGLGSSGASTSAEQDPIQYYKVTKDGREVTIAHLSFTYGLNYEVVPEVDANPWLVNRDNPEEIIELAKKARKDGGADVVIVAPHGGNEYQEAASEQQRQWAQMFADSGVIDLYLGHHVHVPQPMEFYEGGPDGNGMWAFYGVGNLLSNMKPVQGVGTQTGLIAHATITIPAEGAAKVDSAQWVGLVLDTNTNRIFLANGYNQADHPGSQLTNASAEYYYDHLKGVMGDAPELTEPPRQAAQPAVVVSRDEAQ